MSVRMIPGRTSKTGMPSPARRSAKIRAAMLRPAFEMQYSARDGDDAMAETDPMKTRRGVQPATAGRRSSM